MSLFYTIAFIGFLMLLAYASLKFKQNADSKTVHKHLGVKKTDEAPPVQHPTDKAA